MTSPHAAPPCPTPHTPQWPSPPSSHLHSHFPHPPDLYPLSNMLCRAARSLTDTSRLRARPPSSTAALTALTRPLSRARVASLRLRAPVLAAAKQVPSRTPPLSSVDVQYRPLPPPRWCARHVFHGSLETSVQASTRDPLNTRGLIQRLRRIVRVHPSRGSSRKAETLTL
jgi:hypothetical protein